jgi:RimJ/RimL family protein N-acetyltransferase
MMTVIRRADPTDIPWLLEQMRAFDDFFGARHRLFPTEEIARAFLTALIDDEGQPFFIAQNDVRTGFIGGTIGPHYLNPDLLVLSELFWWVVPKFRGSSTGGRLLIEFEEFGRRRGAHLICMTLEKRTIDEGLIDPKSLIARGYIEKERAYLLELPRVAA